MTDKHIHVTIYIYTVSLYEIQTKPYLTGSMFVASLKRLSNLKRDEKM